MHMLPSVNMHRVDDADQMTRMLAAGRAWGAPYVFLYHDVAGAGLLPSFAEGLGKVTLGTEMGSKAQFGVDMLRHTGRVRNVLHHAGVLREPFADRGEASPIVMAGDNEEDYIMSPSSGIFEPFFELRPHRLRTADWSGPQPGASRPADRTGVRPVRWNAFRAAIRSAVPSG